MRSYPMMALLGEVLSQSIVHTKIKLIQHTCRSYTLYLFDLDIETLLIRPLVIFVFKKKTGQFVSNSNVVMIGMRSEVW